MSDTPNESEALPRISLLGQVERIMSRQREGSESLRRLWTNGELDKLPCHDECDSLIVVTHNDVVHRGYCPAHMVTGVCPLTTKAERELRHRMRLAGLGDRYHDPDPLKIRPAEIIDEYVAGIPENMAQGKGLVLSGGVGVGKTAILGYLTRKLLIAGRGVWVVLVEDLIGMLNDRTTRKIATTRAISVEVLMLDDFGASEMPTYILGIMEGIIEHRYARNRPTLVTTNLTMDQLRLEPSFRRMVDRWRETNRFINIGGESMRGAGG